MRNLTIKRIKSGVAALAKMKIYIEDAAAEELYIDGVPCRKLGDLKNGEEKTFQIEDRAAKIFVIADKLSKDISNECYQLPEGSEDIALSGKNKYNPVTGNAFRFDGDAGVETKKNRKKNLIMGIVIICIAAVAGLAIGLISNSDTIFRRAPEPATFTCEEMSITLTDYFSEAEYPGYTACYDSAHAAVFVIKESAALLEEYGIVSLDDYCALILESNGVAPYDLHYVEGIPCFEYEYENTEENETYHYVTYMYKSSDSFWIVEFAVPANEYSEYKSDIVSWAKSVKFDG